MRERGCKWIFDQREVERETVREEGKKLKAVSHTKLKEDSPDTIINDNVSHTKLERRTVQIL